MAFSCSPHVRPKIVRLQWTLSLRNLGPYKLDDQAKTYSDGDGNELLALRHYSYNFISSIYAVAAVAHFDALKISMPIISYEHLFCRSNLLHEIREPNIISLYLVCLTHSILSHPIPSHPFITVS